MKRISNILTVLPLMLFAFLAVCSCGTSGKIGSQDDDYDVYLLIGQSNMAGRGKMIPEDTLKALEGVWLLGPQDTPVPARNPLNQYSTIRKNLSMQQICPGNGFSQAMFEHDGRKILLVVNARGGSALDEWAEGTGYYDEAVRRCREAMKYGRLKGILWHQGCSDSSDAAVSTYLDRLSAMVSALRRDLGVGEAVPFICGELGYWRPSSPRFNEMMQGVTEVIPNSGLVSAEGCGWLKGQDDPHFGRDGQLLLGRRYADKMIEMLQSGKQSSR